MKNIAIITGITGQDGSYLTELLVSKGYVVYGLIRRNSNINTKRINHLYNYHSNELILRYGDLTDHTCIINLLNEIQRTHENDVQVLEIYNLGAMSHVAVSYEVPIYTAQVDAVGVLNILEAIRNSPLKDKIKFYQASTSEIYGDNENIPQTENTVFMPNSPYAVAKLYAYHITNSYKMAYDIFACNGILFNHESPRRGHNFITRKITRAVAAIKHKTQDCLYVGNLDSKRDWGHAKDYVYGMWLMLQQDKPDNYVLSTGEQHTVREFVEKAFRKIDIDIIWEGSGVNQVGLDRISKRVYVRVSSKYFRPNEVGNLLGDCTKAREKLGWRHECDFDSLVDEMVQHDLECTLKK